MSAVESEVQASTALVIPVSQRVALAMQSKETEAKLVDMAKASKTIVTITNTAGYQQVHSARMALKNMRVKIEKTGKAVRDEANKFRDAVIEEQKRLIGIIDPEETRLQKIQDAYEAEQARVKRENEERELQRVTALRQRIADIHEIPGRLAVAVPGGGFAYAPVGQIADEIETLTALVVDEEQFAEFHVAAREAKVAVLENLYKLQTERLAAEAEAARQAEEARQQKIAQDAESARQAEESARLAKQRAEQEAEAKRLADQQAELDRKRVEQEKATREQQEAAAAEQRRREEAAAAEQTARAQKAAEDAAELVRKQRAQDERMAYVDFREALTDLRAKGLNVDSIPTLQEVVRSIEAMKVDAEALGAWYSEAFDLWNLAIALLNGNITRIDNARREQEAREAAENLEADEHSQTGADSQGGTVETAAQAFVPDEVLAHYPGVEAIVDALMTAFTVDRMTAVGWIEDAAAEL